MYTKSDLISFGEFLLSEHRTSGVMLKNKNDDERRKALKKVWMEDIVVWEKKQSFAKEDVCQS